MGLMISHSCKSDIPWGKHWKQKFPHVKDKIRTNMGTIRKIHILEKSMCGKKVILEIFKIHNNWNTVWKFVTCNFFQYHQTYFMWSLLPFTKGLVREMRQISYNKQLFQVFFFLFRITQSLSQKWLVSLNFFWLKYTPDNIHCLLADAIDAWSVFSAKLRQQNFAFFVS